MLMLVFLAAGTRARADVREFAALDTRYRGEVLPLLKDFCHSCHNPEKLKGDLDLAQFSAVADVRRDTRVWEKCLEQLHTGEMPPKGKPQPDAAQTAVIQTWIRDFLEAEARTQAGDPGRTILRRLGNAEYNNTVRDLTGVDLQPAREFPADGAAGEGFLNAGEALSMSPALLEKHMAAARSVAAHAVLLPEGIQFSPSERRGDWTDEVIARIRAIYARHSDTAGATAVNIQGIQFDTNTGGRLAVEKYLACTLRQREALKSETMTIVAAAQADGLNARYLQTLWAALNDPGANPLIGSLSEAWEKSGPEDAPMLAGRVGAWQQALSRLQTVGHMRPWVVAQDPILSRLEIRQKLTVTPQTDVTSVWLDVSGEAGRSGVIWERPRLNIPGRGEVPLRDLRALCGSLTAMRSRVLGSAQACLAAADEVLAADAAMNLEALAAKHATSPDVLRAWLRLLGLNEAPAPALELFGAALPPNPQYDFIRGWGLPETPSVISNASDQEVRVPGMMKPHRVALHPSPQRSAVALWRAPIAGRADISATVMHAHPECGNGVTWSVELRRGPLRRVLDAGISHGSTPVKIGPFEKVQLRAGDAILAVIGPRESNHSCDLTEVDLVISMPDAKQEWSLSGDVADTLSKANPLGDRFGHAAVWHFGSEPVLADNAGGLPRGSLLDQWLNAEPSARVGLATAVQKLITEGKAEPASPDARLLQQLASYSGPLLAGVSVTGNQDSDDGVDAALFGQGPDGPLADPASLYATSTLEFTLPSGLADGAEFIASVVLPPSAPDDTRLQAQVLTAAPAPGGELNPTLPLLVPDSGSAREQWLQHFRGFRDLFPAALCYSKIIPVDEVITLTVFHREDEPLVRLMLSPEEKTELDTLWRELRFIGQDALTVVDAYAQLLEYASQDSDPKLFAHLREPIMSRAAEFRREVEESVPRHVSAVLDLADRAWRRPLTDVEKDSLRALYQKLRSEELAHEDAVRLLITRVLVSPGFLYRAERPADGEAPKPVSSSELASRLGYFLWSSMPDAELRRDADSGMLQNPDIFQAQVRRMLGDARMRSLATEFACQWLHIRDVALLDEKSERHFPEFSALRSAMEEEAILFFTDLFQRDGSVLDVITADHSFLNEALAAHYGIPGVKGAEWRRVDGLAAHGRGGVLGWAAVLAKQSGASRTSPILRGNWLVEVLLGDRLPKPPKGVPPLPESESDGDLTVRQLTEKHSLDPNCSGCHRRVDPFGFALEEFDAIGRRRTMDLGNRPVETGVTLPDGTRIKGPAELRTYLATTRRDEFLQTFCRRLLGFALGRSLRLSDMTLVGQMKESLKQNDYRFSAALKVLLDSPQFRQQRSMEATKPEEQ